MRMIQTAALVVFLLAILVTGVFGTETRSLFYWPGAALLGLAGLMATLKWRLRILFPPSDVCLAVMLIFVTYISSRAVMSPVVAYAREDLAVLLGCVVTYVLTVTVASHPRWRVALITVIEFEIRNAAMPAPRMAISSCGAACRITSILPPPIR